MALGSAADRRVAPFLSIVSSGNSRVRGGLQAAPAADGRGRSTRVIAADRIERPQPHISFTKETTLKRRQPAGLPPAGVGLLGLLLALLGRRLRTRGAV